MSKLRLVIDIDSQDFGPLFRLVEEGIIRIRDQKILPEGKEETNAQKFAAEVRSSHHQHRSNGHTRVSGGSGVRAVECIVAIMQTKMDDPDYVWELNEIGVVLEADYGYTRESASSVLTSLKRNGYVQHIGPRQYVLTDKGRAHPQNDPLPFKYR